MEFEDQEDQEEEVSLTAPAGYESLGNLSTPAARTKMSGGDAGKKHSIRYKECLKNHAVVIGGHAVDGCGEFMPAGQEGTLDALKCAACNCHRNFHRKETDGEGDVGGGSGLHQQSHFSSYYQTPPPPAAYLQVPHRPALVLPLSAAGGDGGAHVRDDQEDISGGTATGGGTSGSVGKKRFRTKFTKEQKEKMLAFAESLGWRVQKHDEAALQQFCMDTGVKRHVLKVWLHNNKHTLGKKP